MQPPASTIGERVSVPGYEVLGELARGGMGVVYKARQVGLNRIVALKMILSGHHAGAQELARFRLEAEAVARLQHPNIVQIYQVGEADGRPFLALEYVGGGTLAARVGQPLPVDEAARLAEVLARAMHAAHQRHIVHRDLKPGNILLTEDGCPKVTDFGLAKHIDSQTDQTRTGAVLGTPEYMAPEQAEGKRGSIGPATDVYALGAILYELLTARPPFRAASPLDTVMLVVAEEPVPPRRLRPGLSADLETICLKCLEKDPRRRYASAQDLAEDCAAFLRGDAIRARPPGMLGKLLRWAGRQPALAATLVALSFFYAIHLLCLTVLDVEGEGGAFHWTMTGLGLTWAAGATLFQRLVRLPRWQVTATFAWASMDVLLLTLVLWNANGPTSSLVTGYLLLTGAAALRYRLALVWFVNALAAVGYLALVVEAALRRPHLAAQPHQAFIFLVMLGVIGLIFHLLLQRVRQPVEDSDAETAGGEPG
jgi:serine/threonine-protein kinase